MTDVGFIGETRRQPISKPSGAARIATTLATFGALAAAIGGIVLGWFVTPFHYYDAIAVVGVALGPAVLVLMGARLFAPGLGGPLKRLDLLCGLFLFGVAAPGNILLYLNEKLDHSPAEQELLPVRDIWIRTGRHGGESFMAGVDASVRSPLGRWSFYGSQPIQLSKAEWRRLVPGESVLALRTHPGRFGFAWYEPDPSPASL